MVSLISKLVLVLVSQKTVTNVNTCIAAVEGLIKQDALFTVKTIAHSVGLSSGSANKILIQQLKL